MHRGPKKRRRPTLPLGVAVPSAQTGLTSLFGMERGGPRRHGHLRSSTGASPGNVYIVDIIMGQGVPWKQATERVRVRTLEKKKDLRRAAPKKVRRAHCASQRAISTTRLRTSLPFHLWPIDLVISHGPLKKSH